MANKTKIQIFKSDNAEIFRKIITDLMQNGQTLVAGFEAQPLKWTGRNPGYYRNMLEEQVHALSGNLSYWQ